MPGVTKPRLAGFMMSMMSAIERSVARPQCARDSGASSGGANASGAWRDRKDRGFGNKPYAAQAAPMRMSAMPQSMFASMGMPASTKPW